MDRRRFEPIHLGPEYGDFAALVGEIERPSGLPPVAPLLKCNVIHIPARTRDLRHLLRLIGRRGEPVCVGLQAGGLLLYSPYRLTKTL